MEFMSGFVKNNVSNCNKMPFCLFLGQEAIAVITDDSPSSKPVLQLLQGPYLSLLGTGPIFRKLKTMRIPISKKEITSRVLMYRPEP